jgi:hypothetical protein
MLFLMASQKNRPIRENSENESNRREGRKKRRYQESFEFVVKRPASFSLLDAEISTKPRSMLTEESPLASPQERDHRRSRKQEPRQCFKCGIIYAGPPSTTAR